MSNFFFRSQGFQTGWLLKFRHMLTIRNVSARKVPIHQPLAYSNPNIGFRDDIRSGLQPSCSKVPTNFCTTSQLRQSLHQLQVP